MCRIEIAPLATRPGWLAICQVKGRTELRRVKLRLRAVRDYIIDGPGENSGTMVRLTGCANVVALVRAPGLRPRPIEAAVQRGDELVFRGTAYTAATERLVPAHAAPECEGAKEQRHVLGGDGARQVGPSVRTRRRRPEVA